MNLVETLICPTSGDEVEPVQVWESRLPDGTIVRYGQLQHHTHGGHECVWSYLVRPFTEQEDIFPPLFV